MFQAKATAEKQTGLKSSSCACQAEKLQPAAPEKLQLARQKLQSLSFLAKLQMNNKNDNDRDHVDEDNDRNGNDNDHR